MSSHRGSCHCGRIAFDVEGDPAGVIECNCSHCPTCGCAPFGEGKDRDGKATIAINIRCLEGIDLARVERTPFDGKSL